MPPAPPTTEDLLLAAHFRPPAPGDLLSSRRDLEEARLQDYAFVEGFTFVRRSSDHRWSNRVVYACIHHGKETQNTRKLTEEQRAEKGRHKRPVTKLDCPVSVAVVDQKEGGRVLTVARLEHSHPPNPNPLQYTVHRSR